MSGPPKKKKAAQPAKKVEEPVKKVELEDQTHIKAKTKDE